MHVAHVTSVDEALRERDFSMASESGVWVVSTRFGRGLDLKLKKDCEVFILDGDLSLWPTDVRQMVGRASRSQDLSHGQLWLVETKPVGRDTTADAVLNNRAKGKRDDGGAILHAIFAAWDANADGRRAQLVRAFAGGKWRTTFSELNNRTSQVELVGYLSEMGGMF